MFVRDFMTRDLIAASVDDPAGATLQRMRDEGLRRMPVMDAGGKLVGMISDRRLLQALAVPTRRGEFRRSVAKPPDLTVGALMNPKVVTTSPDVPLEQAATMMVYNRIGSIVVMEEGAPVGIITETDMFRIFLRLLGGEERGLRVTLRAPAFRGIQADILTDIARAGGSLISLGNLTDADSVLMAFKVIDLNVEDMEAIMEELPVDDLDIREV